MDKEPTSTQTKEFWLKQGLVFHYPDECYYEQSLGRQFAHDGTIDLNNLFKYAKDTVQEKLGYKEFYKLLIRWCADVADGKDPALSLYWLFWEVIHGK